MRTQSMAAHLEYQVPLVTKMAFRGNGSALLGYYSCRCWCSVRLLQWRWSRCQAVGPQM
jgi:hypothetical protein